jgi:DNA-binding MarR family transcriptional regulator
VRHFSRFYTRRIGVLHEGLLASPFSLAEVRVLYELAHRPGITARDLAGDLGLDAGYPGRILQGFGRRKFVSRGTSAADARQQPLTLTAEGRRALRRSTGDRKRKSPRCWRRSPTATRSAWPAPCKQSSRCFKPESPTRRSYCDHRPGDMGWVIPPTASTIGASTAGTNASGAGCAHRRGVH